MSEPDADETAKAAWIGALDDYERALGLVVEGDQAVPSFAFRMPADLGPLPPELGPRANELLEFARAVEQGVASALTKAGQELAATARASRPRPIAGTRSRYVDTRG